MFLVISGSVLFTGSSVYLADNLLSEKGDQAIPFIAVGAGLIFVGIPFLISSTFKLKRAKAQLNLSTSKITIDNKNYISQTSIRLNIGF